MENNQTKINFFQSRSLSGLLSATIQFLKENYKSLLKATWIPGIIYIIASGYFTRHLTELTSVIQAGGKVSPSLSIAMGIFFLFMVLASCYIAGIVASLLKLYPEQDLSTLKYEDYRHDALRKSLRYLFMSIIIGIIFVLCIGIIFGLCIVACVSSDKLLFVLSMLLTFAGIIYLLIPLSFILIGSITNAPKIGVAIKQGFSLGSRYWGRTFVYLFFILVMCGLIMLVASIPNTVMTMVAKASSASVADGNADTLPVWISALYMIAALLSALFSYFYSLVSFVAAYLALFNCVKRREEKLEFDAEQDQNSIA